MRIPDIERFLTGAVYVLGVILTTMTLIYAYSLPVTRTRYANAFLGIGLLMFYLLQARNTLADSTRGEIQSTVSSSSSSWVKRLTSVDVDLQFARFLRRANPAINVTLGVLSLLAAVYVELHYDYLREVAPIVGYAEMDFVVGGILVILVTDATRRAFGMPIASIVIAIVIYAFAGPYLPGLLNHGGMGWREVSRHSAMSLQGIYGFIFEIGATWVAVFIMFAGMAKTFGAMEFVEDVSLEVSKKLRTGIVHVAVVSSMALGSITGSAPTNVATTGSFTIPMMRRQGVRGDFAAAIESLASSGGQLLPPVMGIAAFLMADILGIPFADVIQAAVLPALLFYFSIMISVHLLILKFGWTDESSGTIDKRVFLRGAHYAIPIGVLIYTLVIMRITPLSAGMYTILAILGVTVLREFYVRDIDAETVKFTIKYLLDGLKDGAIEMVPFIGVLAALGIVIEILVQTGFATGFSIYLINVAGENLLLALFLAMGASILFGLGMPTPAAYILVVTLVAPALVQMGVVEITAHMYVFYFAMLAAITPPVAVSVIIAAQIAQDDFVRSCKQAIRIGIAAFLIPFIFIHNDTLILWEYPATLIHLGFALIGIVGLAAGMTGYTGRGVPRIHYRATLLALALVTFFAPLTFRLVAAAAILLLLAKGPVLDTTHAPSLSEGGDEGEAVQ